MLVILGALAAFSLSSQFASGVVLFVVIILAAPLLFVIIVLILGAEDDYNAELTSTEPNFVLSELRKRLLRSSKLVQKARVWTGVGSFYAVQMTLMFVLIPIGKFQMLARLVLWFALVILVLAIVYYLGLNIQRHLREESMDEFLSESTIPALNIV